MGTATCRGKSIVRLFQGLFLLLAGQALLVALLPGAGLIYNLQRGRDTVAVAADREALAAFVAIAQLDLARGRPLGQVLEATQARVNGNLLAGDPAPPLAGRVALFTPTGTRFAGAAADAAGPLAERPIVQDGRTVAIARVYGARVPTALGQALVREQLIGIVAAMGAIFVLLLVSGFFLSRRCARPQIALFRASRALAQGDFDVDLTESGPAETRATMRNLDRIARRFNRLESARRTWLVAVSEELRQPVLALGEQLETIAMRSTPADAEGLTTVVENVRRLHEMAEDLHAVALADLGRLPVTFKTVDPVAIIRNAIWSNSHRAQAQRVTLEPGQLPSATVPVKWDGARIEQLFTALIENSLRYTPPGGRIALGLEGQRGAWRLIIDDSAPGVDVALAQQLFEPFYRTTPNPGESVTTSGLGLATAQAIVEAHHGRIEAGRSPLGGLRITVVLPTAPPTA